MLILSVALGGMLGAFARFRLSAWVQARAGRGFPWGTLAVNVAGSFALGVVLPRVGFDAVATPVGAFLTSGMLGAFTTFSTFAAEAAAVLEERRYGRAAGYVAASVGVGLAAVAAGVWVGVRMG